MTSDEKTHLQTQAARDAASFLAAFKARAAKSYNVTITDEEARALITDALKPAPPQKGP